MESDSNDEYNAIEDEGEIDEKTHNQLINNILNLTSKQYVKKAKRSEPTLKISEYDLVKFGKNVRINDLAKAVDKRSKVKLNKIVKESTFKTISKPLEKIKADRVRRIVAYKEVKSDLDKWEPIVTANRVAEQLEFPLVKYDEVKEVRKPTLLNTRIMSQLELELDALNKKNVEVYSIEDQEKEFPLTIEELMEKRRLGAKMRLAENYKNAKARRQNKIKSKTYRRLERKEKMKQQLKDFELLQQTNPEAALEKLEEIEKARAEERISLRHKGTGKWAKSKQIRAKYDKESRKVLAEQLAKSRDLTKKVINYDSDGDDDDDDEEKEKNFKAIPEINKNNPWVDGAVNVTKDVSDFVDNYRKYWEEKNKKLSNVEDEEKIDENKRKIKENKEKIDKKKQKIVENIKRIDEIAKKVEEIEMDKPSTNKLVVKAGGASEWEVNDIEMEFTKIDNKIREKVEEKFNALKSDMENTSKGKKRKKKKQNKKKEQKKSTEAEEQELNDNNAPKEIDPNKFMDLKVTQLKSTTPNLLIDVDEEEENVNQKQRDVVNEAFEDDDIVDNFNRNKKAEIESNKQKDIDLSLPGWGDWGGKDIVMNPNKKKRFIIKFPQVQPRKDYNKAELVICEKGNNKARTHLVSEVPFPFKTVEDYEASIRTPISNTFVPQKVYEKLIKPSIITKMGTIIQPMDANQLIKKCK